MVKVVIDNEIIECQDYKWGDYGIVLYNATYGGSLWKRVEIFNNSATIFVFKDETVLEEDIEMKPW